MFRHGPKSPNGPITRVRGWWYEEDNNTNCAVLPEPETMEKQHDEDAPWRHDPDIRVDLVDRVRRAIAAGAYDTPDKLELAFERMLESLDVD